MRPAPVLFALLALAPAAALGAPTVTCHCFRNRAYDPADPPAADPYILANARSSLLSAAFGVPKATLVRAVMGGTAAEDLWVAHWVSARTGRDAASLLDARTGGGSWREALQGAKGLSPAFEAALVRGATAVELAAMAVDDVVAARLGADEATIRALRAAGASSEQLVVAVTLAPRLKLPAREVLARYQAGRATWGTLLHEAGLEPEGIERAVRGAVR